MNRIALLAGLVGIATALNGASALAQANRTFVSGHGADSSGCSITAPCRSFAYAIGQTNPGGEIVVLDSAGYGAVTITQAVSITNEQGVEAAITASSGGGNGITINAGAGDVVNLTGITISGSPGGGVFGGTDGILYNTGATVNIRNCVIRGFAQGLMLAPSTINANANVSNTVVSDNITGIYFSPSVSANTFFEGVQALSNSSGFHVDGSQASAASVIQATAADSIASDNGGGFGVSSVTGAATPVFTVVNSKAFANGTGVSAGGGPGMTNATMILSRTTISDSSLAGYDNEGTIKTFGNNYIVSNFNEGSPLTSMVSQ